MPLPTLPQAWVDTTMPAPRAGATTHVCTGVNRNTQLATALTDSVLGDIIELGAGEVFQGPFTLPNKTPAAHAGNPDNSEWVIIRSSAHGNLPEEGMRVGPSHATNMPKVQGDTSNGSAIYTVEGAHHYRFVGIHLGAPIGFLVNTIVTLGSAGAPETSVTQLPHHMVFDRCYIHGDPTMGSRRGIQMNAGHLAVIDSYVNDFKDTVDAQALCGWYTPGPVKVVNNYLEGAGETLMFGAVNVFIPNLVPSDIEIRHNHFFNPLSWKADDPSWDGSNWTIKNLFELKAGRRVLFDGNVLENCWVDGQTGFAILLTAMADEDPN